MLGGALYICGKQEVMKYGLSALMLSACVTAFAQTIMGEAPEITPEFTLTPQDVRDTVIVEDGYRYEGQWPEGEGILYDTKRGLFFGQFSGGVPEGQCTAYFVDGGRYQGEMVKGKEQGYGNFFSVSGKVFAGKFHNDRAHGIDTLYYPDGKVFIGVVVRGRPSDYGEKYDAVPDFLKDRKPVFRERDLTPAQKKWLLENHFIAPLFKGHRLSSSAFTKWVNSQLRYPRKASRDGSQGKVHVEFWLSEDGSVTDVTILESGGELFDKEVIRVLGKAPKWSPAYRGGKPVRYRLRQWINFYQPY